MWSSDFSFSIRAVWNRWVMNFMAPLETNAASESGTIIPSHTIITHIPVCLCFLFVCCWRLAPFLIKTEGIITWQRCIKKLGEIQDPFQTSTAGSVHLLLLAREDDQAFGANMKLSFVAPYDYDVENRVHNCGIQS